MTEELFLGLPFDACAASMMMSTLINGADAGIAIISSAVAAANATLVHAHAVVGQVDSAANQWAQSPVGSLIGTRTSSRAHSWPVVPCSPRAYPVSAGAYTDHECWCLQESSMEATTFLTPMSTATSMPQMWLSSLFREPLQPPNWPGALLSALSPLLSPA